MKRLLILLPLIFAAPAYAQQTGQTTPAPAAATAKPSEFETVLLAVSGPCQRATPTDAATAASTEAVCTKLLTDLDIVRQAGGANVTAHDINMYHAMKSTAALRVSRAFLVQDNNTRTARVCARVDEAWGHASKVNMAASPAEYAKLMQPTFTEAASLTRTCRIEFGMPTGAAPLPN